MKKVLAAMMAAILLFGALPTSALAQITVSNALQIGASGYSIGGEDEAQVVVGGDLTLNGSSGLGHEWSSANDSIATVVGNGRKATVHGVRQGTVTITHTYGNKEETIEITVVAIRISFDANGGTGSVDPIEVPSVGTVIQMPSGEGLSKNNAIFMGWGKSRTTGTTDDITDAVIYGAGDDFEVEEATTFYAVWAVSKNAIYFIRLDGTIPKEPGSFEKSEYSSGMSGTVKYNTFYANTSGVDSHLGTVPGTAELWSACQDKSGSIKFSDGSSYERCTADEFDSKYYVLWYVVTRSR